MAIALNLWHQVSIIKRPNVEKVKGSTQEGAKSYQVKSIQRVTTPKGQSRSNPVTQSHGSKYGIAGLPKRMLAMSAHFDRSRSKSCSTTLIFGNVSERFLLSEWGATPGPGRSAQRNVNIQTTCGSLIGPNFFWKWLWRPGRTLWVPTAETGLLV